MPGPVVVSGGSNPSGVARPLYRRKLMKRLGQGVTYTTTEIADGIERLRQIILGRLVDDEAPIDLHAGLHAYVATGDEAGHQSCVLSAGFHGPLGMLEISKPLTTVLGSGIEVELSATLPADSYGLWPCLNDCINEALDELPVHVDSGFVFVERQVRYDLSDLPWRFRDTDVLDLYPPIASGYTAAQTTARPVNRGSWSVQYDGASPYLQLNGWGCSDGETFYARLRRPSSSYIKDGTWGDSTTGLTDDSQEALYDVDTVVNAALPIACERLSGYWRDQGALDKAGYWEGQRARFGASATVARAFRSFRGNGRQKVGAVGRTWL